MKPKSLIPTLHNPVLHLGDNLKAIRDYPANSIHAVVTDAPYGLNSKDHNVQELVQKYQQGLNYKLGGTGFTNEEWDSDLPAFELVKEIFRVLKPGGFLVCFSATRTYDILGLTLRWAGFRIKDQLIWSYSSGVPKGEWLDRKMKDDPQAHLFAGKNSCLKPALEPIILAQKPLEFTDITENIKKHGTGALNIRAVEITKNDGSTRYPANIITDGSKTINAAFNGGSQFFNSCPLGTIDEVLNPVLYYSKSSEKEKDFGLDKYNPKKYRQAVISGNETTIKNPHPTVKPIALMRHLIQLVSNPEDIVLDCFLGSGTTGVAAALEGRKFIGMEIVPDYFKVAEIRISRTRKLIDKYKTTNQETLSAHLELETTRAEITETASLLSGDPSNMDLSKKVAELCKKRKDLERKLKGLPKAA